MRVEGRLNGGVLLFTFWNNGTVIPPKRLGEIRDNLYNPDASEMVGLRNVAIRMRLIYDTRQKFHVESGENGTSVVIRIQAESREELEGLK